MTRNKDLPRLRRPCRDCEKMFRPLGGSTTLCPKCRHKPEHMGGSRKSPGNKCKFELLLRRYEINKKKREKYAEQKLVQMS